MRPCLCRCRVVERRRLRCYVWSNVCAGRSDRRVSVRVVACEDDLYLQYRAELPRRRPLPSLSSSRSATADGYEIVVSDNGDHAERSATARCTVIAATGGGLPPSPAIDIRKARIH